MKIQKTLSITLLLFVLLLALAACGDSSPGTSSSSSAATALPSPPAPVDVVVTIFDNKIVSSVTTFKSGVDYTFYVRNLGKKHHQFVLLLSVLNGETMTADQLQKASLVNVPDLPPLGTKDIYGYYFPASSVGQSYQMASYLHNDYATGLKLAVVVKK